MFELVYVAVFMICYHGYKTMDEGGEDGCVAGDLVKRAYLLIGIS
jgi:hypothetical protein